MKRLAIFVSGRGSNFEAIADSIDNGKLEAEIAVVLSNNPGAPALQIARGREIPAEVLPSQGVDTDTWSAQARDLLAPLSIDLVCLAGFMRRIGAPLLEAYPRKILNIHPSLLPSFPGLEVQKAALEYGVKISGCTVHFVEEGIDSGPILTQAAVPVLDDDTPESLAARILKEEHRIYTEAIEQVLEGAYRIDGRRVVRTAPPKPKKKTLPQLLEKAEDDHRGVLGSIIASQLGSWRSHLESSEGDLMRFLKEWLRRPDPNRVRLVDRDGGMSVEKIVLDHYPERFTPEERAIARKTLNRQG
jgi:phosphoribosylglycinamide formyltransferase-1